MSFTSVLFPEPETPVTQTKVPSGNRAWIDLRLLWRAPITSSRAPLPGHRVAGTAISLAPARYRPVSESGVVRMASSVPWATR